MKKRNQNLIKLDYHSFKPYKLREQLNNYGLEPSNYQKESVVLNFVNYPVLTLENLFRRYENSKDDSFVAIIFKYNLGFWSTKCIDFTGYCTPMSFCVKLKPEEKGNVFRSNDGMKLIYLSASCNTLSCNFHQLGFFTNFKKNFSLKSFVGWNFWYSNNGNLSIEILIYIILKKC